MPITCVIKRWTRVVPGVQSCPIVTIWVGACVPQIYAYIRYMTMTLYDIDIPCHECGGFLDDHLPDCPEVPQPLDNQ